MQATPQGLHAPQSPPTQSEQRSANSSEWRIERDRPALSARRARQQRTAILSHAPSPKLAIADPRYELSVQIGLLYRRVSSLTGNLCDAVARLDTDAESIDAAAELIAVTAQKLGNVALRIKTLSAKAERLDRSIAAGRRASLGAQERCA